MSDIQDRAVALQNRILAEMYFDDLWLVKLKEHNMTATGVDECEYADRDLIFLCHWFWEDLPDTPSIRRGPFLELCEIAELVIDLE